MQPLQLRLQLPLRGTLTQPFHCHLQTLSCKAQKISAQRLHKWQGFCSSKTEFRRQSGKTTILKHFLQGILRGQSSMPKMVKICCPSTVRKFHAATLQCDSQPSGAKHSSITLAAADAGNLDAASPLRSADTELLSAIELQRATWWLAFGYGTCK